MCVYVCVCVCVCVLEIPIFNSTVQATCTSTSDIWSIYHCTDTLVFGRGPSLSNSRHFSKRSVYICVISLWAIERVHACMCVSYYECVFKLCWT